VCVAISAVMSLLQAPPQSDVRVLAGLPEDVMTRVTMSDGDVVYGVRNDGVWQLVARPITSDGTGVPQVLVTAPAGLVLMSPALAPDGRLYFESNVRTQAIGGRDDSDVWAIERSARGWGKSSAIGAPFASEYNEHSPTVDAHGTICFNSTRPRGLGRNDIYCGMLTSRDEPRLIASVSSASQDASPWLSADGNVLLFASNRPNGAGGWDIYMSRKVSGEWADPRNLGSPINTAGDETWVTLSTSGDKLLFNRIEPGAARGQVHVTASAATLGR